jgi:hypothetical protein
LEQARGDGTGGWTGGDELPAGRGRDSLTRRHLLTARTSRHGGQVRDPSNEGSGRRRYRKRCFSRPSCTGADLRRT